MFIYIDMYILLNESNQQHVRSSSIDLSALAFGVGISRRQRLFYFYFLPSLLPSSLLPHYESH